MITAFKINTVKQTYYFSDLPAAVVKDQKNYGLRWTRGIEREIKADLGEFLSTRWTPLGLDNTMKLDVEVEEHQAEDLSSLLKNMYNAELR